MRKITLLIIALITFTSQAQCEKIEKEEDKFDSTLRLRAPEVDGISLSNSEGIMLMFLQTYGATPNVGKKGVTILLKNGDKINKSRASISTSVDGSGYLYSSMIILNEEDINKLLESEITDYRLYIYEGEVSSGNELQDYLRCLMESES